MSSEPLLEIIDDLGSTELFAEACKIDAAKGWYFGHASREEDWGRFWKMDLEGIQVFDLLWQHARERCEQLVGAPLRVIRQYANGHTYGLGGQAHHDDVRPGSFTLLYYPVKEWKEEWEGETVFYGQQGEIALSVRPRPNRAILFDSRIVHAGRSPSRACPSLRVTVAYKLEASAAEAEPPAPAVMQEGVVVEEGVERSYTVRIAGDRVRTMVEEHLAKLGQTLRLPGFRPGKIPRHVLEQRYGTSARADVLKRLADEAASSAVPKGSLVAAIDISPQQSGDVELRLTALRPPDLPEPDLSRVTLERLTASESELESAGLTVEALRGHLKQQVLDYLERTYVFTAPGAVVEREFAAIWQAAQSRGATADADAAEFRRIAERRVRLGIVVAEMARRYQIAGPGVEDMVIDRLLARALVIERPATADELHQMA
ncbi:MAG: trigger factor [Bryobacteraceae bacterium]